MSRFGLRTVLIEERGQRKHAVANAQVSKERRDIGIADHELVAPMLQSLDISDRCDDYRSQPELESCPPNALNGEYKHGTLSFSSVLPLKSRTLHHGGMATADISASFLSNSTTQAILRFGRILPVASYCNPHLPQSARQALHSGPWLAL